MCLNCFSCATFCVCSGFPTSVVINTLRQFFRRQYFKFGKNPNNITLGIIFHTWILLLEFFFDLLLLWAISWMWGNGKHVYSVLIAHNSWVRNSFWWTAAVCASDSWLWLKLGSHNCRNMYTLSTVSLTVTECMNSSQWDERCYLHNNHPLTDSCDFIKF